MSGFIEDDNAVVTPLPRGEEPAAMLVAKERRRWIRPERRTLGLSSEVPAVPAAAEGVVDRPGRGRHQVWLRVVRNLDAGLDSIGEANPDDPREVGISRISCEDDAAVGDLDLLELVAVAVLAAGRHRDQAHAPCAHVANDHLLPASILLDPGKQTATRGKRGSKPA